MTVYVVDRSNNNPPSDAELDAMRAAGIRGLILKVSEGTWLDPTFADRARAAHARGFDLGGYAFLHANVSAQTQADTFNRGVAAAGVPIPVRCCDAETADGDVQAAVDVFCPAAAINLLYSGAYFARSQIAVPVPGVDWWIAAYGAQHPTAPWGTEAGWQFTDKSRWGDLSMFDDATWAQLAGRDNPQGDDDMPKAFVCEDPATAGGTWAVLTDDGEVDAAAGAPYLGGLNNHPEFKAIDPAHPIVGIAPWRDTAGRWGYAIAEYDPTPPAGQGRVRYYRFPRDARYAKAS